jgi:3-carboxy-cis,cis-muconate cycloisomerase
VIPEASVLLGGALESLVGVVGGLVVNADRMRENLDETRGFIVSEEVMMQLAPRLGRQRAHELLYEASMAAERGTSLVEVLRADHTLVEQFPNADELERLLDPAGYTGLSAWFADAVLRSRSP